MERCLVPSEWHGLWCDDMWHHSMTSWCHVTSHYDVTRRHRTNFGAKGLANVRCGRYVNAQAFSFCIFLADNTPIPYLKASRQVMCTLSVDPTSPIHHHLYWTTSDEHYMPVAQCLYMNSIVYIQHFFFCVTCLRIMFTNICGIHSENPMTCSFPSLSYDLSQDNREFLSIRYLTRAKNSILRIQVTCRFEPTPSCTLNVKCKMLNNN